MSDYHFSVTQIKRSAGQTAIAAAAYRAGEKLYSDYYGEYSDYTKKSGVIESGILLPSHLPKAYEEREFLWNEVEKIEKHPKAQLAYSFDFSLQNEFPLEENIEIARQFIRDNFVSRGMIADYAIHLPERGEHAVPNPHVHVLCPIRPMEPDGTWGAKQHRVTRLDEIGNPILGANGKPLFDAVPTTDWGSAETLEQWRAAWAEINNEHFAAHGIDERLDHRSYEKQGISILPTVHEGPNVREMEKKGIRTDKGDRNRWVKTINRSLRQFASRLRALVNWIAELKAALQQKPEPSVIDLLDTYIKKKSESAWSRFKKTDNLKEYSKYVFYLETHDIHTVSDLEEHILKVNEKNAPLMQRCAELRNKLKDLDFLGNSVIHYEDTRPTYEKWRKMVFGKEKYRTEHETELKKYHAARRKLSPYLDEKGNIDDYRISADRRKIENALDKLIRNNKPAFDQVKILNWMRKAISSVDEYKLTKEEAMEKNEGMEQPVRQQKKRSRDRGEER